MGMKNAVFRFSRGRLWSCRHGWLKSSIVQDMSNVSLWLCSVPPWSVPVR